MDKVRADRKQNCEFHPEIHFDAGPTNSIIREFEKIQATLVQNPSLYVESDKDQQMFRKVCAKTFNIKYCLRLEAYAARLREDKNRKNKDAKKDGRQQIDRVASGMN